LTPAAPVISGTYTSGDTVITGTASNDLALLTVYADGVAIGSALVQDLSWTVSVAPVGTGQELTAKVTTIVGDSPLSAGKTVS